MDMVWEKLTKIWKSPWMYARRARRCLARSLLRRSSGTVSSSSVRARESAAATSSGALRCPSSSSSCGATLASDAPLMGRCTRSTGGMMSRAKTTASETSTMTVAERMKTAG
eukprot:Amastigsp_a175498_54.p5 type:complete len:112 gc:universal Amastigsp_a175498_54:711-376(-)